MRSLAIALMISISVLPQPRRDGVLLRPCAHTRLSASSKAVPYEGQLRLPTRASGRGEYANRLTGRVHLRRPGPGAP